MHMRNELESPTATCVCLQPKPDQPQPISHQNPGDGNLAWKARSVDHSFLRWLVERQKIRSPTMYHSRTRECASSEIPPKLTRRFILEDPCSKIRRPFDVTHDMIWLQKIFHTPNILYDDLFPLRDLDLSGQIDA